MKYFNVLIAFCLSVPACSRSTSDPSKISERVEAPDPTAFLRLQSFASCSETDAYLRVNVRKMIQKQFDNQRMYLARSSGRNEVLADSSSGAAEGSQNSAPQEFTKTNVQVEGVDEPDIVKTNGTHIFSISGSQVMITQSWPAEAMIGLASIEIDGHPLGLMLTEQNQLVVASYPRFTNDSQPEFYPWYYYGRYNHELLHLDFYDVKQPQSPVLLKTLRLTGNYATMRRQGDMLRVVQKSWGFHLPSNITQFINTWESGRMMTLKEFDRQRAAVEAANEQGLAQLTTQSLLQNWRSKITDQKTDDVIMGNEQDCHSIFAAKAFSLLGFSTISSIDLRSYELSQAALLAPVTNVYASTESLYLVNNQWEFWWGWFGFSGVKTFIHKFRFDSPTSTAISYQGSGVVNGDPINQFALDEYQGNLRIAVTDSAHVEDDGPRRGPPAFTTVNRVYVLAGSEDGLNIIGQTPDLAPGERIFSARFHQDKGYVVTFRQVDPLFTLNLADPRAPEVSGELKVEGFSSYIHLMDESHLLTVGRDADPQTGWVKGLKISVFDVSNPAQPLEKFKYLVAGDYSWSEAQYDHHAFTYFPSRGLLGLPVGGSRKTSGNYWWDYYFSELMVFNIDRESGITPRGSIVMNDLYQGSASDFSYWWYGSQVRRSIFADDNIYAISGLGVRAVHNSDLAAPVQTVSFFKP
jgi:uncharacterized secreted protein with C-terminal beta-propeller domain